MTYKREIVSFVIIYLSVCPSWSKTSKESICDSNPCGEGACVERSDDYYLCICPADGFAYTQNCVTENCSLNPCKNGGVCKPLSGTTTYECQCPNGFNGSNCEIDINLCHPNPCKNGFPCIILDGNATCKCQLPYRGDKCEIGPCTDNPCQNGGKCTMHSKVLKCECLPGFFGERCEKDTCYLREVCKNGGTCIPTGHNKFKCVCIPHFFGLFCEKEDFDKPKTAEPKVLNVTNPPSITSTYIPPQTEIKTKSTNFTPTITSTYFPSRTEIQPKSTYVTPTITSTHITSRTGILTKSTYSTCDCGRHSSFCKFDDNGDKVCSCKAGFSQLNDACIDCYCGEHSANCFYGEHKEKKCWCDKGYAPKSGRCKKICNLDADCHNGGICKFSNETYGFCECHTNYSGDRCEVNNACKTIEDLCAEYGAICVIREGLPQCECPPEKVYKEGVCEMICGDVKCVHGQCEIFGNSYKCRCFTGYTGRHCDENSSPADHNEFIIFSFAITLTIAAIALFGIVSWLMFSRMKNKVVSQDPEKRNLI